MKMFVIEDNKVAKVFDDFPKEEYFNNRDNIRRFSPIEAQDFLKDNGYETSEKLQSIVFVDGCDCCKDYFTIPGWGWESEDSRELTNNDIEYFDKIIHAYDNNIEVTEWSSGTTIDGDTLNFCEDCYSNKNDKELGIVSDDISYIFKDVVNMILHNESSLINKNFNIAETNDDVFFKDEKESITEIIKEVFLDKIAYSDFDKVKLNQKDISLICSDIYGVIDGKDLINEFDGLDLDIEKEMTNIVVDAFISSNISVDFNFDKLISYDDFKLTRVYVNRACDFPEEYVAPDNCIDYNEGYELLHEDGKFILHSSNSNITKELSSDDILKMNKYDYDIMINDFLNKVRYKSAKSVLDDFEKQLFTALSSDDNLMRGRLREVLEPVVMLGKSAETFKQFTEYRQKLRIIYKLADSMGETKLVDSVWHDCMNKCHSKPVQQTDTPKTYLSEAMTDAIKALKEKGLSLPEIGKAFNEASKEVLVQLGKENLANKGR